MDEKNAIEAEERAVMKILSTHMRTIIYYYQELEKKLKEQNEILEEQNRKLIELHASINAIGER